MKNSEEEEKKMAGRSGTVVIDMGGEDDKMNVESDGKILEKKTEDESKVGKVDKQKKKTKKDDGVNEKKKKIYWRDTGRGGRYRGGGRGGYHVGGRGGYDAGRGNHRGPGGYRGRDGGYRGRDRGYGDNVTRRQHQFRQRAGAYQMERDLM